jgi:hypothetical protein
MTFDGIGWDDVAKTLVGWLAFFLFPRQHRTPSGHRPLILFAEAMPNTCSSAGNAANSKRGTWAAKSNLMADGGQELAFREKIRGNDATDPKPHTSSG